MGGDVGASTPDLTRNMGYEGAPRVDLGCESIPVSNNWPSGLSGMIPTLGSVK